MDSDEDVTWTEEEIEEWEHDEWLRMEAMGGPSLTEVWEEQREKIQCVRCRECRDGGEISPLNP